MKRLFTYFCICLPLTSMASTMECPQGAELNPCTVEKIVQPEDFRYFWTDSSTCKNYKNSLYSFSNSLQRNTLTLTSAAKITDADYLEKGWHLVCTYKDSTGKGYSLTTQKAIKANKCQIVARNGGKNVASGNRLILRPAMDSRDVPILASQSCSGNNTQCAVECQ